MPVLTEIDISYYKKVEEIRKKCGVIEKGQEGYGFKYADLIEVRKVIDPILEECKASIIQDAESTERGITIFTSLIWDEVNCKTTEFHIPWEKVELPKMTPAQSSGGVITYFRRYAIISKLNLVTSEDADSRNYNRPELSDEKVKEIGDLLEKTKVDEETFLQYFKCDSIKKLSDSEYRVAISKLKKKETKNGI